MDISVFIRPAGKLSELVLPDRSATQTRFHVDTEPGPIGPGRLTGLRGITESYHAHPMIANQVEQAVEESAGRERRTQIPCDRFN